MKRGRGVTEKEMQTQTDGDITQAETKLKGREKEKHGGNVRFSFFPWKVQEKTEEKLQKHKNLLRESSLSLHLL